MSITAVRSIPSYEKTFVFRVVVTVISVNQSQGLFSANLEDAMAACAVTNVQEL